MNIELKEITIKELSEGFEDHFCHQLDTNWGYR